jgi:hypothetical protein
VIGNKVKKIALGGADAAISGAEMKQINSPQCYDHLEKRLSEALPKKWNLWKNFCGLVGPLSRNRTFPA